MISAKQARELVEQSVVMMTQRLDLIDAKITEAATLGRRELYPADVIHNADWLTVNTMAFRSPEFTPIQRLLKKELERAGFAMNIVTRETKIGGGLGSMDDEIEYKPLPDIKISW